MTGTTVTAVTRSPGDKARLCVEARCDGDTLTREADVVLVVVGVRPDTDLAADAGARLGVRGAIDVDQHMRTGLPGVYAAGDCVVTHHQLLATTWLPLGTSRAASPARTPSAGTAASPAPSAPRS